MVRDREGGAERKEEATGSERWSFDRRSYMKLAGASAATAVSGEALVGTASARNRVDLGDEGLENGDEIDPYLEEHFVSGNEVHIPEGGYRWRGGGLSGTYSDAWLVGDGNVVFRIADGQTNKPSVLAEAGRVVLANITIRGTAGAGSHRMRFDARSSDAEILVHNVNQPDGAVDGGAGIGLFVGLEHTGTATFRDCVVRSFPNNGIYASAPGKNSGGDGAVHVVGGLYQNNNIANVRVGSTGSSVRECVIVNDAPAPPYSSGARNQRGLWVRSGGTNVSLVNNDISQTYSGANSAVLITSRDGGGGGEVRDTRIRNDTDNDAVYQTTGDWSGNNLHLTGSGNYSVPSNFTNVCKGSGCDEPRTSPRDSAGFGGSDGGSGGSSDDSGSSDSSSGTDDSSGSDSSGGTDSSGSSSDSSGESGGSSGREHTLEVVAVDGGPKFDYAYRTTGAITKVTEAGDRSAEGNDSLAENDDGTYTANGTVGNGYGDTYQFDGDASGWRANTGEENYRLVLDNREVTVDEFNGSGSGGSGGGGSSDGADRLEIVSADGSPKFGYAFTVEGTVEKVTDASETSAERNDSVTDDGDGTVTAEGVLGDGYGDAFDVEGTVIDFTADTDPEHRKLYLNDRSVTVVELTRPNKIVVDARDETGKTSYEFEVSGQVERSRGLGPAESTETVSGSVVTGEVTDAADGFRFSGDVVSLDLDGPASVIIEDTD